MTWLKLDDSFHLHPKVAPLSDRAFRLHMTAMLESSRLLTNGNVAAMHPNAWGATAKGRMLQRTISELVAAGLWEPVGDWGWQIHDFLEWNPHSTEVLTLREKRSLAGSMGGKAKANALASAKAPALALAKQTPSKTLPRSRTRSRTNGLLKQACPPPPQGDAQAGGQAQSVPSTWADRLVTPERTKGEPPPPRKDPLGERITFAKWFPSLAWLDWQRELGMADRDFDAALTEARDKLPGHHDIEWWDLKVARFVETKAKSAKPPGFVAHEARTGRSHGSGGDPDWPTARDVELRTQIAAGQWGERLAKLLNAGRLDASLARREVAEVKQARAERARVQS